MNFKKMAMTNMIPERVKEWLFWIEKCNLMEAVPGDGHTIVYLNEDLEVEAVLSDLRVEGRIFNHVFMTQELRDKYLEYRKLQNYEVVVNILVSHLPEDEFEQFIVSMNTDEDFSDHIMKLAERYGK